MKLRGSGVKYASNSGFKASVLWPNGPKSLSGSEWKRHPYERHQSETDNLEPCEVETRRYRKIPELNPAPNLRGTRSRQESKYAKVFSVLCGSGSLKTGNGSSPGLALR